MQNPLSCLSGDGALQQPAFLPVCILAASWGPGLDYICHQLWSLWTPNGVTECCAKGSLPPISSSTLNLGCLSKKLFLSEVPTEVRSNTKFRVPNPCPDLQCLPSAPQLSTGVTEPPRARLLFMPSQQKDIHPLQSLSAVHAQLQ